ncbi:MAG: FAD-binding oxidoreductase [Candidatus Geothermincolia bacterium]
MISDEAYRELAEALGEGNVSREPAVLDSYAWQPFANDDPKRWVIRPAAVALPGSTQEVQVLVRILGRHGLKFKAYSNGWGLHCGPSTEGVVQVDMRRMNRIIEIDEKNMFAVIEPYVCGGQLQAEAMKVGLNTHIIGAGPGCMPLASATSGWGVGWDGSSMSYSGRNVLGVEWVLPDGEVLRLGTLGSGSGWFCGDGPGPSLRGIMRGSMGAFSGLGIFTRCAVKLFNWPGPPETQAEGLLLDVSSPVPEHARFTMLFFPDRKSQDDAIYKVGEYELAYLMTRTSIAAFAYTAAPHVLKKIAGTSALREMLTRELKYSATVVMMADSAGEIEYKDAVLKQIALDAGGFVMDITRAEPIASMFFLNFIRNTAVPVVFRAGGMFYTALDRNETWDTQMNWADAGEKIKEKWIAKGGILDDMADNPFMAIYEDNTWAHCEEIFQYDPRNPEHLQSLLPIMIEFSLQAIEQCMEPLSAMDARLRKLIGPIMGNYTTWQKRISASLDSGGVADTGFYCDEVDFDWSKVDPELRSRLDELLEKFKWTESGPPDLVRR